MTTSTKVMSPKQFGFIITLIVERADKLGIEPNATSAEAWMFQKRETYTSSDASNLIAMLQTIKVERTTPLFDTSHLSHYSPTRVITNKFAKACDICGHKVDAGAGLALMSNSKWITTHRNNECVEPYVGQAFENARQRVDARVKELCLSITTLNDEHDVFFALPSHTGNNDLDFFALVVDRDGEFPSHVLRRILGGEFSTHGTSRSPIMSTVEAERVLEIVASMSVDQMIDAQFAYASNLGRCSICNRTLTDDASRARGMGSECWSRWGI